VSDTINPQRRTVIFTHGWQETGTDPSNLWIAEGATGQGALALLRELGLTDHVNVLWYSWPGAFTGATLPDRSRYVEARAQAFQAGVQLASGLRQRLGGSYSQPLHFVGHSLGTVVDAVAALYALPEFPLVTKVQFTVLDHPSRVWKIPPEYAWDFLRAPTFSSTYGFKDDFFARVLALAARDRTAPVDIQLDNYFSHDGVAVGERLRGTAGVNVYNHVALEDPGVVDRLFGPRLSWGEGPFDNDHTGVHQWYRWTIKPDLDGYLRCPVWDPGILDPDFFFDESLNPCDVPGQAPPGQGVGWSRSLTLLGDFSRFPQAKADNVGPGEARRLTLDGWRDIHGCTFDLNTGTVTCSESSSAYAQAQIEVPPDTAYISFRFSMLAAGEGDEAAVFVDDDPIWSLPTNAVPAGGWYETGPLPLRGMPGPRTLTIALNSAGAVDARFAVTDFQVLIYNSPPLANAGRDRTLEAIGPAGATVTFDGTRSSDAEEEELSFLWNGPGVTIEGATPTLELPLGEHRFVLTVRDQHDQTDEDDVVVSVRDTTPPSLSGVPGDITTEATHHAGTQVMWQSPAAFDLVDGAVGVVCDPASGASFALGITLVSCTASDASGNAARASFQVDVVDTLPPTIIAVAPSVPVLWPANHKMVPVTVLVDFTDADPAASCQVVSVTSNEAANGRGDGNRSPDWELLGGLNVALRAERSGRGSNRVYTLTVECSDTLGNRSSAMTAVTVPHDQDEGHRSREPKKERHDHNEGNEREGRQSEGGHGDKEAHKKGLASRSSGE
jgi:hypothetical protein